MSFTLRINNIDRTSLMQVGSLRISKPKGNNHTASFKLVDESVNAYHPVPGEHVLIQENGVTIFKGQIEEPEEEVWFGPNQAVEARVSCSDYTRLLHHYWVCGVWANCTASDILFDIFSPNSPYCDIGGRTDADGTVIPSEGIIYIPGEPGISIGEGGYAVQNRSVFEVISELAELSEYEWSLDYNKNLTFAPAAMRPAAPIQINNNSRNFRKMSVKRRLDEYCNESLVLGAVCETNPQFAEYRGDGKTTTFKPTDKETDVKYNILDVAPNDEYPTGCKIIDTSLSESDPQRSRDVIAALQGSVEGAEVYFSSGSMDLTVSQALTATQILRFRYTGEYPIWALRSNMDAIAERAAVEGGGALYQHMEQDGTIDNPALAINKAEAILNKNSTVPRIVTFETDMQVEPNCRGLSPGQEISIQLNRYNLGQRDNPSLPDGFVIHNVDIEDVGGKYLRYTVECVGSDKSTWVDAFRKLAQPERIVKRAGDATVHMLRRVNERLRVSDSMIYRESDGIPWVATAQVGFCEVIGHVEKVHVFISPGLSADYFIAR